MSEETKEKSHVSYEKTCEHCGGTFTAYKRSVRFCSKKCDEAYRRSLRPPKVVKCKWCGREFLRPRVHGGKYRYCSDECKAAAMEKQVREGKEKHLAKLRAANAARLMVKCVICGKEFFSPRGTAKYCSPRCKFKNSNIKQAERAKRRERLLEDVAPEDRAAVEKTFKQLNRHEGMYKKRSESGYLLGISKKGLDDIGNAIFA